VNVCENIAHLPLLAQVGSPRQSADGVILPVNPDDDGPLFCKPRRHGFADRAGAPGDHANFAAKSLLLHYAPYSA